MLLLYGGKLSLAGTTAHMGHVTWWSQAKATVDLFWGLNPVTADFGPAPGLAGIAAWLRRPQTPLVLRAWPRKLTLLFQLWPCPSRVSVLVREKGWLPRTGWLSVIMITWDHASSQGKSAVNPSPGNGKAKLWGPRQETAFLCVLVSVRCALTAGHLPPLVCTLCRILVPFISILSLNHEPNWLLPTHFICSSVRLLCTGVTGLHCLLLHFAFYTKY